jgi:hypothetical protein
VLGLIGCVEVFFIPPARLQGNSPTCLESTNAAQKNNKLFISPVQSLYLHQIRSSDLVLLGESLKWIAACREFVG